MRTPNTPAYVLVEPELFDDRCRVTVARYTRTGLRKDVYTDLTLQEVIDLLEGAGIMGRPLSATLATLPAIAGR